jgi:hypothetical protein
MKAQEIDIKLIVPNNGQVEGLPKNPRFIKDDRFKKLVKSIQDDPEMLALREVIVYPHDNKYIAICGNMRYRACLELKHKTVPCKVLPENTPPEKLRAYTIKDNVAFGNDDFDLLANEWDELELSDWGVVLPELPDISIGTDEFSLKDGDKAPFQQMTFTLADEQAEQIKNAIDDIKKTQEYKYAETMGNENSNGNALYLIVMQWAEQKK